MPIFLLNSRLDTYCSVFTRNNNVTPEGLCINARLLVIICPTCWDSNGFEGFLRADLLLLLTLTDVQLHLQQSADLRPGRAAHIALINTNSYCSNNLLLQVESERWKERKKMKPREGNGERPI